MSMTKFLRLCILLMCLIMSGCPLASMMSDRLIYKFQGSISNSLDHKRISSAKVIASCEKTILQPPLETFSDANGLFILNGYFTGALDDCELNFEHPQFKLKTVKLQPARDLKADTGFMRIWTVDVELEPN
jgi:hypothetical protein